MGCCESTNNELAKGRKKSDIFTYGPNGNEKINPGKLMKFATVNFIDEDFHGHYE